MLTLLRVNEVNEEFTTRDTPVHIKRDDELTGLGGGLLLQGEGWPGGPLKACGACLAAAGGATGIYRKSGSHPGSVFGNHLSK